MATNQQQTEDRARSKEGAATSQDTDQPGAMTRAAPAAASLARPFGPLSLFSPFSPFSMMRRMFSDLDRMLDPLMSGGVDRERGMAGIEWMPRMDVAQRDGKLVVRVDLPGMSPEQVSVFLSDDALVVEGERTEETNADPWHSERIYGRFRRVIGLPGDVDLDAVEARFENGVLEVSLPVQGSGGRGRQIEIRTSSSARGDQAQAQGRTEGQPQTQTEAQGATPPEAHARQRESEGGPGRAAAPPEDPGARRGA